MLLFIQALKFGLSGLILLLLKFKILRQKIYHVVYCFSTIGSYEVDAGSLARCTPDMSVGACGGAATTATECAPILSPHCCSSTLNFDV